MNNFWNDLPRPFFILAPMEAVTDVVFRHVVARAAAPDIYFTEFTNTASYCSPKGIHSTRGRLDFTPDEQPIVAQIWGKNPDHFRQMAHGLKDMGFAGIDINMGCPDKSVVKGGSGSALIRTPDLAAEIIAATKEAGLPVSVKTRLGDSRLDDWKPWLTHILNQDIVNLTIHLRTRKEMSKVDAHYELTPEIKALRDEIAPQTLLTINGDIRDRQHGLELVEKYGVDGVMIGRGIFSNPFAFKNVGSIASQEKHLQPEVQPERTPDLNPSVKPFLGEGNRDQLIELLKYHLDLFDQHNTEEQPRAFDPLKRFFKIYIRDFPGASELREKLMHTKSTDEVRYIISESV